MDKKIVGLAVSFFSLAAAVPVFAVCNLVAGHNYYSDGVGYFKDSKCQQDATAADLNSGSTPDTSTTYISTGNPNCRYSVARQQYTDGMAFFTDSACHNEALNGQTAAAPTVQTAAPAAAAPAAPAADAQYQQLSQRVDALARQIASLQSIMMQILTLLAKK